MGKKLSTKKALAQYAEAHELYKEKTTTFNARKVKFRTNDGEYISIDKVNISLTGSHYTNTPYYNIGIHWEDADHDLSEEQIETLESSRSRSASTGYQKMEFKTLSVLIKNDDIAITIEI